MTVTAPKSGTLATVVSVKDMHDQVRALMNSLGVSNLRPGSVGPQHIGGLVLAKDSAEQPSSSAWTVTTHATVPPEPIAEIIGTWDSNATLRLNNAGAGYTIPKPFILIECLTYRVDQLDGPGFLDDGLFINLYKESDGGTTEVSPVVTRYHRIDTGLYNAGGPSIVPADAIGHSPTIWRVTEYTGVGSYQLDLLEMRAICVPRLAGVGPDVIVRNGRIWFIALRIPG